MARSSGNCYGVLPAGYLFSGSAAGVYYGQIQSTTSIKFFNNLLTSGPPVTIANPTAFSGLSGGSFTQITTVQTGISITVPGNTMGPNGRTKLEWMGSNNNSAGAKTFAVNFGGFAIFSLAPTTNQQYYAGHIVQNQGVTSSQVAQGTGNLGYSTGAGAPAFGSQDTTGAITIAFVGTLAAATDWMEFSSIIVEEYPN